MTIVEKAAYLKGLSEGLGIDSESKEGKLWSTLCELVSDMAHEIEDLQATSLDYAEVLDEMGEELTYLEEITCDLDMIDEDELYEDDDECPGCSRLCCDEPVNFSDLDDYEDDEYDEDEELEYDGVLYDVTCPVCGEEITFDDEILDEGGILCPKCGEELEFDLDGTLPGEEGDGE